MKVAKFGGSSVADSERVRKVCEIIAADPDLRIIVVSAPGKRHSDDRKVTDLLITCADLRLNGRDAGGEVSRVISRYEEIAAGLGLPPALTEEFRRDLCKHLDGETCPAERFEDSIKALGEAYSGRLLAAALTKAGMEAAYVDPGEAGLTVTEEYGNARVKEESYPELARPRERDGITVFPGFFGYTENGHVVTFSRGGSDLTGAILAAAVGAVAYENFTDVDGIRAADPKLVKDPRVIKELTYRELRELSYGGFTVFHEEAMLPVLEAGIPINVRNTNNPSHPGTTVVVSRQHSAGRIIGVACDQGFCTVYVRKYLMNREKGFGRKLLGIIEEEDLSFDHMPSGVDSITVVLRMNQLTERIIRRVRTRIYRELGADDVSIESGIALLSIVGEGMKKTVGFASRVTGALARAGVNIEMIIQGPSELTMILGVRVDDPSVAVQAIYDEFFA